MDIMFLDFDGVLNTPATWARHGGLDPSDALDRDKVTLVGAFVSAHDLRVVISSAWRIGRTRRDLARFLERRGFSGARRRVIGITPDLWAPGPISALDRRGEEIAHWVERHAADVRRFAILDDLDPTAFAPVQDHLVQTNPLTGVTARDLKRARTLLRAQPDRAVAA